MKKEPDSLKWWQKEIDRTLRCWSWVGPPAGPDSTSNISMFLGQQVFAKYRPKSRNFKPATIVGIRDGTVDLRFDGYDDIVCIPTLQIRQIPWNLWLGISTAKVQSVHLWSKNRHQHFKQSLYLNDWNLLNAPMPFDHFGRSTQKPIEICRNAATATEPFSWHALAPSTSKAVNVAHEDDALQCLEEAAACEGFWRLWEFALVTWCKLWILNFTFEPSMWIPHSCQYPLVFANLGRRAWGRCMVTLTCWWPVTSMARHFCMKLFGCKFGMAARCTWMILKWFPIHSVYSTSNFLDKLLSHF